MQSDILRTNNKISVAKFAMEAISEKLAVTRELYTPITKYDQTTC